MMELSTNSKMESAQDQANNTTYNRCPAFVNKTDIVSLINIKDRITCTWENVGF